eukprot:gene11329-15155_t
MLNRVSSGWVHYKLDRGVDHVLIDEAQDTSPRQWDIVTHLISEFTSGEGARDGVKRTVFAVGCGTAPWNANLEAAVLHDWFKDRDDDSFYKLSAGTDLHLGKGLWMSLSIGRTFWRGAIANQTSGGVTLKKSFLN